MTLVACLPHSPRKLRVPSFGSRFDCLEQSIDDLPDRNAVRLGSVAQEDPMTQGAVNERTNIIECYMRTTMQESSRFRAENQGLGGPDSRTPAHPLIDELRRSIATRSTRRGQTIC